MTGIELLAVWSVGIALIFMIAERAKASNWKDSIKSLVIYGAGIYGLVLIQPLVAPYVARFTSSFGGGVAAVYFTIAVGVVSALVAIGIAFKFYTKESRLKKVLSVMFITILGTAVGILYFRPGFGGAYHINYIEWLALEAGMILLIGGVIYWKHGPQNALANPIAFVVLVIVINWLHYVYYGVNPLSKLLEGNVPEWWGAAAVTLVCILVFQLVWFKAGEWCKKWSYRILWPLMLVTLLLGMSYTCLQLTGYANKTEARIKGLRNQVQERLTNAKLQKIWSERQLSAIQVIVSDPKATLGDLEKAVALAEKASEEAEETVASAPSKKPTYNEKKMGAAATGFGNGVKSGSSAVGRFFRSINPFGGGSGGGRTEPETTRIYGPANRNFRLVPGLVTNLIQLAPGLSYSFEFGTPGGKVIPFSVIYEDGQVVTVTKVGQPLPNGKRSFRLRAEMAAMDVTLNVYQLSIGGSS